MKVTIQALNEKEEVINPVTEIDLKIDQFETEIDFLLFVDSAESAFRNAWNVPNVDVVFDKEDSELIKVN